jgi:hypothetical protein
MKVELAVLTPGRWAGKAIEVPRFPFVIGRDPACHLRPSSPKVGPRECALFLRADKVIVRELEVSAGTLLNGHQIHGEEELHADDRLEVGPLAFGVRIEDDAAADPAAAAIAPVDEESAAAFLLEQPEGDAFGMSAGGSTADTVPQTLAPGVDTLPVAPRERKTAKLRPAEPDMADTAAAAREILARRKKVR